MARPRKPVKPVCSFRLDPQLKREIQRIAEDTNVSDSDVLSEGVMMVIEKYAKARLNAWQEQGVR